MQKKIINSLPTSSILITHQNAVWSKKRLLSLGLQLTLLIFVLTLITRLILSAGENRLQQDWATKEYRELQTVANLLVEKVNFQKFRTQILSQSEILQNYLASPSIEGQQNIIKQWKKLQQNIPELIGMALHTTKGELDFSTHALLGKTPLPKSLLGTNAYTGTSSVYTSPMQLAHIDGEMNPFMHQFTAFENNNQQTTGYISTYNSMSKTLQNVKSAFSNPNSSLLIVDTQGQIFAGVNAQKDKSLITNMIGENLSQNYPKLWKKISKQSFGQYQNPKNIVVYLKIELAAQYEAKHEYYLISYINKSIFSEQFSLWENALVITSIILGALLACIIILFHFLQIEKIAKEFNIKFNSQLFNAKTSWLIVSEMGRIFASNKTSESTLSYTKEQLNGKMFERIINFNIFTNKEVVNSIKDTNCWHGNIPYPFDHRIKLHCFIQQIQPLESSEKYFIINLDNECEIEQQKASFTQERMLNETSAAIALISPEGDVIDANANLNKLFPLLSISSQQNVSLVITDTKQHWHQIIDQLKDTSIYESKLKIAQTNQFIHVTLSINKAKDHDIENIICTFFVENNNREHVNSKVPNRSSVLTNFDYLESYFKALSSQSRDNASLLLISINPKTVLSLVSHTEDLTTRQNQVELQVLRVLPYQFQIARWMLGKLIIIMPSTTAFEAHQTAALILTALKKHNLLEGVSIGISSYQAPQTLRQLLANAEIALERAPKDIGQPIFQAFTKLKPKK